MIIVRPRLIKLLDLSGDHVHVCQHGSVERLIAEVLMLVFARRRSMSSRRRPEEAGAVISDTGFKVLW